MKLSLFPQPVVQRKDRQLLRRVDVDWTAPQSTPVGEWVVTSMSGQMDSIACEGRTGRGRVTLWCPEPLQRASVKVEFWAGGRVVASAELEIEPCRPWSVHLLHQSHFDYGYTTLQSEILRLQIGNLDTALDDIERAQDRPERDRFRWNIECTWPLLKFLESRPESCLQRLLAANRAGLLEVAAMPFTLQSEGCTVEELIRALEPVRRLRELGFSIRTAVQSDVPGVSALLPRLLNDIGIRHLAMAPNNFRAPFHATALKELPRPFLWNGPHGGELLTWFTDLHDHVYQEGNNLGFIEDLAAVENRLGARLAGLENSDFPWRTLGLRTQGSYSDNGRPNFKIAEIVREWNAKYVLPQVQMSTFSKFFDEIESETRGKLKQVKAFWPDWWNEGLGSMARDFAMHRRSQDRVEFAETALALAGANREKSRKLLDAAWENILLCDEHTWGAAAPAENAQHGPEAGELQMACKRSFFFQGSLASEQAENSARAHWAMSAPTVSTPSLSVQNALSWPRSGCLEVPLEELAAILPGAVSWTFRDLRNDRLVTSQTVERHGLKSVFIHVEDVPAFGQVSIAVEASSVPEPLYEVPQFERDLWRAEAESEFSSLSLCPLTGAVREWKRGDVAHAGAVGSFRLGSVVRQTFARRHFFFLKQEILASEHNENSWLKRIEHGPLFSRILTTADCGEMKIQREWVLHHTTSRLDLITTIKKGATNDPEAIFMALPFNISDGNCILGTNGGPMPLDDSFIPGSSSDWFVLRDHLDVSGPDGGIMVSLPDTPLVQLGDISKPSVRGTGKDSRELFVYVMNNLWPTNFAPAQGGEFTFRAQMMDYTHPYDAAWSGRRALECRSPLRAFALGSRARSTSTVTPPIHFQTPDHVNATLSPQTEGIRVLLEEIGGSAAAATLHFPGWKIQRIERTSIIGEPQGEVPISEGKITIEIMPNQIVTLLVRFETPPVAD